MAIADDAVLLPAVGHVLIGTHTSTAKPSIADLEAFAADTSDLPTGLTDLGHTDLDEILSFDQEGGDTEVKGSWQNKSLREIVTEQVIDFFVAKALQVDNTVLQLYFGGGDITEPDEYSIPDNPTPQEKAVCIILIDGETVEAIWMAKASVRRESGIEFAVDDFTKFPLRITPLKSGSLPKMTWIAEGLGTPA